QFCQPVLEAASGDEGDLRLADTRHPDGQHQDFSSPSKTTNPTPPAQRWMTTIKVSRGAWAPEMRGRIRLSATREAFHVQTDLDVFESGTRVFCRSRPHRIRRDFL